MDERVKNLWVKALESGEYPQGTNQLRSSIGLCCLGVLCDLHAREHPEIAATQEVPGRYMAEVATLPEQVMQWAGMGSVEGELLDPLGLPKMAKKVHSSNTSLAALNDDGLNFKQIAKVIRANWKDL